MEGKLGRDVFVALAAVAWSDGTIDEDEADAIVRTAAEEGLEIEELNEIEELLKKPVDIEKVDLSSLSKADRLFVYAVGAWIARVDGNIAPEEITALNKLAKALRIPDIPRERADKIAVEIGRVSESTKPAFFQLPMLRKTLKVRLAEAQELRRSGQQD
jgi:uncharacterized membrane protein YebE (DUF533 family)